MKFKTKKKRKPRKRPEVLRGRGKIFVISAPSGSGKTTLCRQLLSLKQSAYPIGHRPRVQSAYPIGHRPRVLRGLVLSVSATTRIARGGERANKDYFFISQQEFESQREKGAFLEWAKVLGNFYGTPRELVERELRKGKDVILNIDVQGAMQVKKKCPSAVLIFIAPPSFKNLKERLRKRSTEDSKEIVKRLNLARKEMSYLSRYDYVVVNDTIKRATQRLKAIITTERRKIKDG